MSWLYKDEPFLESEDWFGFVYKITHIPTGKSYIGRKYFTNSSVKTVKGKKKRSRKESDWQNYWGSSKELLNDLETLGKENFQREILRLCKTRAECSYYETKFIFEADALLSENYWNNWVSVRVTRIHTNAFLKK